MIVNLNSFFGFFSPIPVIQEVKSVSNCWEFPTYCYLLLLFRAIEMMKNELPGSDDIVIELLLITLCNKDSGAWDISTDSNLLGATDT